MSVESLVAEAAKAEYDPEDLDRALTGSFDDRKRALMRLMAGAYKRGWDECEAATKEALAFYDMAHLIEGRA